MSEANKRQVGGDHYKGPKIEHWDWSWENKHDPFQYQITKYVDRHHKKNGLQDLLKAKHFLEKYIELLTGPGGKYEIKQPTYGDGALEREWEHANTKETWGDLLQDMEPGSGPGPSYVDQDGSVSITMLNSDPLGVFHDSGFSDDKPVG